MRTYTLLAGPSQRLLDVTLSENRHRVAIAWFLMPDEERQTTFIKVDGDEREIVSAGISKDGRRILLVVEYVPGPASLGNCVALPFATFFGPELRAKAEQCDIQCQIAATKASMPPPSQIHFCFTETRDVLNHK